MAPCNMKCYTCGEYIAKGKKFNARKEDVENLSYLGIRIYRFYIKCPGCLSEISFRTDPESTDYIIEAGAHRNFQALKLAEEQAAREADEVQKEIESNPMLLLENRTQQSQYEMELLESLEDLRELNDRNAGVDLAKIAHKYKKVDELTAEQLEAAEKMLALKELGYEMIEGKLVKRLKEDDEESDDDDEPKYLKKKKVSETSFVRTAPKNSAQQSLKSMLSGAIRKKVSNDKPTGGLKTNLLNGDKITIANPQISKDSSSSIENGNSVPPSGSIQDNFKPVTSSDNNSPSNSISSSGNNASNSTPSSGNKTNNASNSISSSGNKTNNASISTSSSGNNASNSLSSLCAYSDSSDADSE